MGPAERWGLMRSKTKIRVCYRQSGPLAGIACAEYGGLLWRLQGQNEPKPVATADDWFSSLLLFAFSGLLFPDKSLYLRVVSNPRKTYFTSVSSVVVPQLWYRQKIVDKIPRLFKLNKKPCFFIKTEDSSPLPAVVSSTKATGVPRS